MLGSSILPGTGYVEILRASFEELTGDIGLNIVELFLYNRLWSKRSVS